MNPLLLTFEAKLIRVIDESVHDLTHSPLTTLAEQAIILVIARIRLAVHKVVTIVAIPRTTPLIQGIMICSQTMPNLMCKCQARCHLR